MITRGHVGAGLIFGSALIESRLFDWEWDYRIFSIFFLFVLIGSVFPDFDLLFLKREDSMDRVFSVHRQFTHGYGTLALIASPLIFWQMQLTYFVAYVAFVLGMASHIVADTIFGKGGVPLLFYERKVWKRVRLPIFANGGVVDKFMVPVVGFAVYSYSVYKLFHPNYILEGIFLASALVAFLLSKTYKNFFILIPAGGGMLYVF